MPDVLALPGGAGIAPDAADRPGPDPAQALDRTGLLDALLRHAQGAVFVRDRDGRFLLASEALAAQLGRAVSDIVGRTAWDLLTPELAAVQRSRDAEVWAHAEPRVHVSTLVDEQTGTASEFVTHRFPITGRDGEMVALGGHTVDLSELAVERRSGRESEARFRALFDLAPIGQILSAADGTVTALNPPMARMLGYEPAEMIGRPAQDFVADDEVARVLDDVETLRAGAVESVTATRRFRHRLGHVVPVSVTSAVIGGGDRGPRWWISMVRDISDEERARAERDRSHQDSLRAAERLRVLHAASMAANEASDLDAIAPVVLRLVCEHLQCRDGAVLAWPEGGAGPAHVRYASGTTEQWSPQLLSTCIAPVDGDVTAVDPIGGTGGIDAPTDSLVVVPLSGDRHQPLALAFRTAHRPDADQTELLGLIAGDVSRVIERETAGAQLRRSEERFRSVFDSSPLPMGLTLGDTGTYCAVNTALCTLLGLRPEELIGRSARDICHPDDVARTDPAGAAALASPHGTACVELRLLHSSGSVVFTSVTLTWMQAADGPRQLLAQIEDVTQRRTVEAMLRRQAEEDGLTGLANRARLARTLAEYGRDGLPGTALFIDLDGFKLINDTRGHDVGDEVLGVVAQRLRNAVRETDLVARFGGDEFVVLCHPTDGPEARLSAHELAQRIRDVLAPTITTSAGPAGVTASIGIAHGRVDTQRPQLLIERADLAMYEAKRLGKDRFAFFDAGLRRRDAARKRTEHALRTALDDDRFIVHYQPIVRLADRAIVGFEALVRLVDDDGALVPPTEFIGVAEQSGLILPMGAWVLRRSCAQLAAVRAETGRPVSVAVNVAARQASRPDFAASVLEAVDAAGLPSDALSLELTESALLEADESTLRQLETLRGHGVLIALDDFGTGYSSLTYLRQFPVSHLKVDRSFVAGMRFAPGDRAIVRAVTGLAADLGITWVAEGVETLEQQAALAELGDGLAQGYLYSRPVPGSELVAMLASDLAGPLSA